MAYNFGFIVGATVLALLIQWLLSLLIRKLGKTNRTLAVTFAAIVSVPLFSVLASLGFGVSIFSGFKLYAIPIILAWGNLFFIAFMKDTPTQKPPLWQYGLSLVFVVSVLVTSLFGAGLAAVKDKAAEVIANANQSVEEFIAEDVASVKSELPLTVDTNTTMVDVIAEGRSVTYFYETGHNREVLNASANAIREGVRKSICADKTQYLYTVEGFVFNFHYSANDSDAYDLKVSVTRDMCDGE